MSKVKILENTRKEIFTQYNKNMVKTKSYNKRFGSKLKTRSDELKKAINQETQYQEASKEDFETLDFAML